MTERHKIDSDSMEMLIHKTEVLLSNHWTAEEIATELRQPISTIAYWTSCIKGDLIDR